MTARWLAALKLLPVATGAVLWCATAVRAQGDVCIGSTVRLLVESPELGRARLIGRWGGVEAEQLRIVDSWALAGRPAPADSDVVRTERARVQRLEVQHRVPIVHGLLAGAVPGATGSLLCTADPHGDVTPASENMMLAGALIGAALVTRVPRWREAPIPGSRTLEARALEGARLRLRAAAWPRLEGTLLGVSPDSVRFQDRRLGEVSVARSGVQRVERPGRGSFRMWGAALGVVAGTMVVLHRSTEDLTSATTRGSRPEGRAARPSDSWWAR